jgi:membrane protease YdiL (CAAX protease family)
LYHAAPSVLAAIEIVVAAIIAIFMTQVSCKALGAPLFVAAGASFAVVTLGLLALVRGDVALVGLVRPRARFIVAGALVGLSAWYVDFWLEALVHPPGDTGALEHLVKRTPLVPALVSLALLPAIGEELVFRGVLARALARRLPMVAAVGLSAIVFSSYHLVPAQVVGTLPLALLLGLLAIRSDSVLPGAIAHFTNNAVAIVLEQTGGGVVGSWIDAHAVASLVIACAMVAVAVALTGVSRPTFGANIRESH